MAVIKGSAESFLFKDTLQSKVEYAVVGVAGQGDVLSFLVYSYRQGKAKFLSYEQLRTLMLDRVLNVKDLGSKATEVSFTHARNRLFQFTKTGGVIGRSFFVLSRIKVKEKDGQVVDKGFRILTNTGAVKDVSQDTLIDWLSRGISQSVNVHIVNAGTANAYISTVQGDLPVILREVKASTELKKDMTNYHRKYLLRLLKRYLRFAIYVYPIAMRFGGTSSRESVENKSYKYVIRETNIKNLEIFVNECMLYTINNPDFTSTVMNESEKYHKSAKSSADKEKYVKLLTTWVYTFLVLVIYSGGKVKTKFGDFNIPKINQTRAGHVYHTIDARLPSVHKVTTVRNRFLPTFEHFKMVNFLRIEVLEKFYEGYKSNYKLLYGLSGIDESVGYSVSNSSKWGSINDEAEIPSGTLVDADNLLYAPIKPIAGRIIYRNRKAAELAYKDANKYSPADNDYRYSDVLESIGYTLEPSLHGKKMEVRLNGYATMQCVQTVLLQAFKDRWVENPEEVIDELLEKCNYIGEIYILINLFVKIPTRTSQIMSELKSDNLLPRPPLHQDPKISLNATLSSLALKEVVGLWGLYRYNNPLYQQVCDIVNSSDYVNEVNINHDFTKFVAPSTDDRVTSVYKYYQSGFVYPNHSESCKLRYGQSLVRTRVTPSKQFITAFFKYLPIEDIENLEYALERNQIALF